MSLGSGTPSFTSLRNSADPHCFQQYIKGICRTSASCCMHHEPHTRLGRWKHEAFSSGPHVHNDGQRAFTPVLFLIQHVPHRAWNSNAHSVTGFKNNFSVTTSVEPGYPELQFPESTGWMASLFAVVSGGESHKAILGQR